jgi:hypothetical protein
MHENAASATGSGRRHISAPHKLRDYVLLADGERGVLAGRSCRRDRLDVLSGLV